MATPSSSPRSSGSTACPSRSTATASISWSATTATGRSRKSCTAPNTPPTSAACSRSSASATSRPIRPRPRAGSSGSGRLCRTVSLANCACGALPPSRPPMPTCRPSSPTTTDASPAHRSDRRLAAAAAGSRPLPQLSLPAPRRPRQHRPPRAALGADPRGGPAGHSYAGCRVELRELLDGRLLVFPQDRCLATLPSPGPAFVLRPRSAPRWPAPPSRAPRRAHRDRSAPPGAPIRTGAGAAPDYPDHGDSEPTYRVLAEMKATGDVSPRPLLTTSGATSRDQRL